MYSAMLENLQMLNLNSVLGMSMLQTLDLQSDCGPPSLHELTSD